MVTCMKDGMVEDWELFENFMDYIYNYALHTEPENHPMLMTEPAVNYIHSKLPFTNQYLHIFLVDNIE